MLVPLLEAFFDMTLRFITFLLKKHQIFQAMKYLETIKSGFKKEMDKFI